MGVQYNLSYHSYEVTTDHVTIHVQFIILRATWAQAIICALAKLICLSLAYRLPYDVLDCADIVNK